METQSEEYARHLKGKYHAGRFLYLSSIVYPSYVRELSRGEVWDLGCGLGEFLLYCRKRNIVGFGIDSNPYFVKECQGRGLSVFLDNIISPHVLPKGIKNAVCDNVLEHLSIEEIRLFLNSLKTKMIPGGVLLIVVPGLKGYARDPTHKTYVDRRTVEELCREMDLDLTKVFYHPVHARFLGDIFYLNMTILKVRF